MALEIYGIEEIGGQKMRKKLKMALLHKCHCEDEERVRGNLFQSLDCFVAALLSMTKREKLPSLIIYATMQLRINDKFFLGREQCFVRFVKSLIIMLVLFVIFLSALFAQSAGNTMADFLKLRIDAKAVAMGGCYSADDGDIYSMSWNMAGLSNVEDRETSFSHLSYVALINYENVQYAQKLGGGTIGIDAKVIYIPEEKRAANGNKLGNFSNQNNAFMIGYSKKIDKKLIYGFGVKYIYMSLDSVSGDGYGIDLGALYKISDEMNIGASVQNIGPRMKLAADEANLPTQGNIGFSYKGIENLLFAGEISMPFEGENSYGFGADYSFSKYFAARAGYKYRNEGNYLGGLDGISAGFGMKISRYSLDYAFVPFGNFDVTHRLSLKIEF